MKVEQIHLIKIEVTTKCFQCLFGARPILLIAAELGNLKFENIPTN